MTQNAGIVVIWVKILKNKTIEIHVVRLSEVCGEVLREKYSYKCTKPLSTIQCNKTLCQDQLDLYYS